MEASIQPSNLLTSLKANKSTHYQNHYFYFVSVRTILLYYLPLRSVSKNNHGNYRRATKFMPNRFSNTSTVHRPLKSSMVKNDSERRCSKYFILYYICIYLAIVLYCIFIFMYFNTMVLLVFDKNIAFIILQADLTDDCHVQIYIQSISNDILAYRIFKRNKVFMQLFQNFLSARNLRGSVYSTT